ncbi:MAG TPA: enoyl-CoA hydratase/isomerase family protein [bacterium]|nr:enoyl-CoA hydratase/isomerase family protein [bacterium]
MDGNDGRVTLTRHGRAARLVLDRPPLNILTLGMLHELAAACEVLAGDPEVTVVTLASAGPRAFCVGVDVAAHAPDRAAPMLAAFQTMAERMLALDQVVIAAVQGPALGGGWELALLCDLVVAAEGATFGVPEVKLAALPPLAAAALPRLVGTARALDLVLTGRPVSAEEALRWGLVARVVPAVDLGRATDELAAALLAHSGVAVRLAKRAVAAPGRDAVARALREATALYRTELLPTTDAAEGIAAFMAKRPPAWKHA